MYCNEANINDGLNLKLVSPRVSFVDKIDDFSKVFHEDIEIKCFYEGSSTLCIGTENIIAEAGDVVFINPYEFHSTVENGTKAGKYHLLMISLDLLKGDSDIDLRSLFIREKIRLQNLIRNDDRINALIRGMVEELLQRKYRYESVVRGMMLELFSLLLRSYTDDTPLDYPTNKRIRNYQTVYPAVALIRRDCTKEHNIEELAAVCGVSKYHFCRIFKDSTSMTVVEYRNEYRLQTADAMLKTTDKTVSEVAVLCGFDDAAYFSRCYKKKYGISPIKNRAILSK